MGAVSGVVAREILTDTIRIFRLGEPVRNEETGP